MLWDPIWFLILEAISFPLWFFIGVWLDSGRLKIKKVMLAYLAVRFGCAALLPLAEIAWIGTVLEIFFWLGVSRYAIVLGLRFIVRRVKVTARA